MLQTKGGTDNLISGLSRIHKTKLEVGIVEPSKRKNGKRLVDNAAIFKKLDQGPVGKKGKSWPTLEDAVKNSKRNGRVKSLLRDAAVGNGAAGINKLGDNISLKIKSNIQGIKSPALEASTIRKKGNTNPLVDTGQLKKAIGYKLSRR